MTLQQLLNKIRTFKPVEEAIAILRETEEELISYMKDQLYAGQDGKGQLLSPTYLTDPFFKAKQAAEAYAKWKAGMKQLLSAPYLSPKPYAVPNLIITGELVYDRLVLNISGDRFSISPVEQATRSMLEQKYGAIFKLNPTVLAEYKRQVFVRRFVERFKKSLQ